MQKPNILPIFIQHFNLLAQNFHQMTKKKINLLHITNKLKLMVKFKGILKEEEQIQYLYLILKQI